jgi:hypothetical protein
MGGIFQWVRNQVRDAVLGGFSDAVNVLRQAPEPEALLLEHRPPVEEPEPEPARNGRGRK